MIADFDSSAFVKLLVDEPARDAAVRVWDDADTVIASRLVLPEVSAAVAAARQASRLDGRSDRQARRDWDDYWGAVHVVELTTAVATEAAALAYRLVLGGADAVHLASALTVVDADTILVAWDRRLTSAALAAGLAVVPGDL